MVPNIRWHMGVVFQPPWSFKTGIYPKQKKNIEQTCKQHTLRILTQMEKKLLSNKFNLQYITLRALPGMLRRDVAHGVDVGIQIETL